MRALERWRLRLLEWWHRNWIIYLAEERDVLSKRIELHQASREKIEARRSMLESAQQLIKEATQ